MTMQVDHNLLISRGINVAGQYIMLHSELRSMQAASVKVVFKDLPLHSVTNEEVLEVVKEYCKVSSEVKYANLWFEGKMTSVRNGDCFIYIPVTEVSKLPAVLEISGSCSRVFKPPNLTICKRCSNQGHHPTDPKCPARTTDVIIEMLETF